MKVTFYAELKQVSQEMEYDDDTTREEMQPDLMRWAREQVDVWIERND